MTRLTEAQVKEVQAKYLAGGITQQELADEYNVYQSYISRALQGKGPHDRQFRKLDTIDHQILNCIEECEGLSMVDIYRCYNLEADKNLSEQFIRYRINSLEEMGHIRTIRIKGKPAKRACFHRVNQDL